MSDAVVDLGVAIAQTALNMQLFHRTEAIADIAAPWLSLAPAFIKAEKKAKDVGMKYLVYVLLIADTTPRYLLSCKG